MNVQNNLFATINGIKICYNSYGIGFPLVLIHGFGAKKEIWKPQINELSKNFMIIIYDLRGTGKSDRPNIPYTMEMFADDLKGLLDSLQIKKAHILGRSLGGMIAQNFVLKYPEIVNKLILMTTNAATPDERAAEMIEEAGIEGLKLLKQDPTNAFWQSAPILFHQKFRRQMQKEPTKKFFGLWSVEDLIKDSIIDPPTVQDIKNRANSIKTHKVLNRLNEIKNKTLLIAASHDRLTPKSAMIEMHEILPNSTLKVIQNAGHFVHLSNALEVNKLISDFLES